MMSLSSDLSLSAGQWQVTETVVTCPASKAWTQLCKANPLRWALIIGYPAGTPAAIAISTLPGLAAGTVNGLLLQPLQNPFMLSYEAFGLLASVAWFGAANTAAPSTVSVIEILAVPQGGP